MLATGEDILPRFREHLAWATQVDIATAWVTSHDGLRALQRQRLIWASDAYLFVYLRQWRVSLCVPRDEHRCVR